MKIAIACDPAGLDQDPEYYKDGAEYPAPSHSSISF